MTDTPAEVAAPRCAQFQRLMRDLHRHALDDDFAIVWNAAFRAGRESLQSQLAAQRERDGRDAERYRWLRDATPCSLSLSRNEGHATNYMTAADWIEQFPEDFADEEPAEVDRMKATNTIWQLQIYPNTPIGFNRWHGATLDAAIDAALKDRP